MFNKRMINRLIELNGDKGINGYEIDHPDGDRIEYTYWEFHLLEGYDYNYFYLCKNENKTQKYIEWELYTSYNEIHDDYKIALKDKKEYTFNDFKEEYKDLLITKDSENYIELKTLLNRYEGCTYDEMLPEHLKRINEDFISRSKGIDGHLLWELKDISEELEESKPIVEHINDAIRDYLDFL